MLESTPGAGDLPRRRGHFCVFADISAASLATGPSPDYLMGSSKMFSIAIEC